MEPYVCSVCGELCGQDSRMGSLDRYLVCECARKEIWINDGRGGYSEPLNGAHPVPRSEYLATKRSR